MFKVVPQNTVMHTSSIQVDSNSPSTQCPKRLCRGPCSDTLDGRCGTLPEQDCVWLDGPVIETRHHMSTTPQAVGDRAVVSKLQKRLCGGAFVHVCEIHSPKVGQLGCFVDRALALSPWFEAMNVTGQLKGRSVMPSPEAAGHLRAIGVDAIAILTGRDGDQTQLLTELAMMHCSDVGNLMCLTGDGGQGHAEAIQMDSLGMLRLASGEPASRRLWLGAVINPFSTPATLPLLQLEQKIESGADFVQTQMVFDLPRFEAFCDAMVARRLHERVSLLAGVPVVVSQEGLALVKRLPGVWLPGAVEKRLRESSDIRQCGIDLAKQMIASMRKMLGVRGVHVMLLGGEDVQDMIEVVQP